MIVSIKIKDKDFIGSYLKSEISIIRNYDLQAVPEYFDLRFERNTELEALLSEAIEEKGNYYIAVNIGYKSGFQWNGFIYPGFTNIYKSSFQFRVVSEIYLLKETKIGYYYVGLPQPSTGLIQTHIISPADVELLKAQTARYEIEDNVRIVFHTNSEVIEGNPLPSESIDELDGYTYLALFAQGGWSSREKICTEINVEDILKRYCLFLNDNFPVKGNYKKWQAEIDELKEEYLNINILKPEEWLFDIVDDFYCVRDGKEEAWRLYKIVNGFGSKELVEEKKNPFRYMSWSEVSPGAHVYPMEEISERFVIWYRVRQDESEDEFKWFGTLYRYDKKNGSFTVGNEKELEGDDNIMFSVVMNNTIYDGLKFKPLKFDHVGAGEPYGVALRYDTTKYRLEKNYANLKKLYYIGRKYLDKITLLIEDGDAIEILNTIAKITGTRIAIEDRRIFLKNKIAQGDYVITDYNHKEEYPDYLWEESDSLSVDDDSGLLEYYLNDRDEEKYKTVFYLDKSNMAPLPGQKIIFQGKDYGQIDTIEETENQYIITSYK